MDVENMDGTHTGLCPLDYNIDAYILLFASYNGYIEQSSNFHFRNTTPSV